jgi:hypothetical protein
MKRRVLGLLCGALFLVTVLTLFSLFSSTREENGDLPTEARVIENLHDDRSPWKEANVRLELNRVIRTANAPGDDQSHSRPFRYRKVDLDEIRRKHGLPPVMAALREAGRYRPPTPQSKTTANLAGFTE